jgi:hypothetical protein
MRHHWITGRSVVVAIVVGGIVVVCGPDGGASPRPSGDTAGDTPPPKDAIMDRPAIFSLPASCGPAKTRFRCNPLTSAGCDRTKDEACDDDDHGGFVCYAGPNSVKEGGECNDDEGCQAGLGCDMDDDDDDGVCKRFCCTNAECGPKRCVVIDKAFGSLGFCD